MPWPSPSHVGLSDINPVTWVNANTNTRSKNSSSGIAARSSSGSSGNCASMGGFPGPVTAVRLMWR
jgi:hypothetical protein